MSSQGDADILVVAHKTAGTPALLDAIRERASRGPARFHLLVPNPHHATWHPSDIAHPDVSEGEQVLALALPLIEEAAGAPVEGSVSPRHDPMDAVEEALHDGDYDEIILSTLPRAVSAWLHIDLPHRVSDVGPAADHRHRARGSRQVPSSAGRWCSVASRRVIDRNATRAMMQPRKM